MGEGLKLLALHAAGFELNAAHAPPPVHFAAQRYVGHAKGFSAEIGTACQVGVEQRQVGRGGGVGRALIEQVYAAAQAAGANRVHWLTQADNTQARMLYDRIANHSGFVQYRQLFS